MEQEHSHQDFLKDQKPEELTYLKGSFSELNWVNTMSQLPTEENPGNKRHKVNGYNYSKVTPTPRDNPKTVSLSGPALALLDLDKERVEKDPDTPLYLAGNKIPDGAKPVSNCYCGHQFGTFAGQLGDGRAITLGDIRNHKGELWELQLKGSGTTPYSRFADGKAVLRSSIREYLCSEAMWALGIPTTRAASLIVTDSLAERDPLYNGRKIMEKCAIVLRLAPTFFRFGSFEIFKDTDDLSGEAGPSYGREDEMMPAMLDFLLKNHFPEIAKLETDENLSRNDCYFEMYKEIVKRTALLFALWQCYGFCHGVLNTDNMSVLGLTIDYGPYGWMDYFDKGFICNHSDQSGRYSYENQPSIGKWNLLKLAEALKSHLPEDKMKEYTNQEYDKLLKQHYYDRMREKLGFYCVENSKEDLALIDDLLDLMHENGSDFNNTFRKLSSILIPNSRSESNINEKTILEFVDLSPARETILERYRPLYSENQIQQIKAVAKSNPMILMMMNVSPEVIEQQEAKLKKFKEMENVDEEMMKKKIYENWEKWLKAYESRLFVETSAVSSEESKESHDSNTLIKTRFESFQQLQDHRIKRMNATNPVYILRNYMAEEVIKKAEKGDFSGVNNLLELLLNPFEVNDKTFEGKEYTKLPPKWAAEICVSCSS